VEAPSEMLLFFPTPHCSRYSSSLFAADLIFGRTGLQNCSWFIQVSGTPFVIFQFSQVQWKSLKTELSQNL